MKHTKSNKADIQGQAKNIAQSNNNHEEQGAILVIVLVLIFAVTLALLAFLYLNKNNSLIASNLAVQNAAQEATDQGLLQASQYLQNNNPSVTAPSYFYTSMSTIPASYGASTSSNRPVPPAAAFWNGCANNSCYQLPQTVKYGPYNFQVEYIIFASPGISTPLDGYQISGGNAPMENYYLVYVHAQNTNGGGMSVTVQSVIRKVQ
jgi:Tfp pilus assembly protein PilX